MQLPHFDFFNELLTKSISHAKRGKKILAVLIIKINYIESGYTPATLEILKQRFTSVLRTEDVLVQANHNEFRVLLHDIGKAKFASVVANKILQVCNDQALKDLHLTVSIGISVYPNDGNQLEELLAHASTALEKAEKAGGNNYHFYAEEIHAEANEYLQLGNALRNALQNNELTLYFQPKMHLKKGVIIGVEALVRWAHPDMGVIHPAKFITIAEEAGLMIPLGEWILREACKVNKYWQTEGFEHITMAINLSPKQFHHPDIANKIAEILQETGLNPQYLELEINESTVMDDIQSAAKKLESIKAHGVHISIDHFGTGYTSISHLKKFPVSTIKIDQSFIKGVPYNPDDSAITNAFIALAHHLGLEVVAEGVETAEQVQYLGVQNCDIIQGYFISHPLPAQKIQLQLKKLSALF